MSKLKELCEIRGRVGWKGYTVDDLADAGPLVIGANDITDDNMLDLSDVKHLTREKYEESPEIFIEKNDILVVKVGSTIGKVGIIDRELGEATINPNCVIVRAKKINPYFLYCYLCSPAGHAFLLNNSSASGQPALNQTDLGEMDIPVVDEHDQDQIVELLSSINKKIENNNKIRLELQQITKTIYDYWFMQFEYPNADGKPYKLSKGRINYNKEAKREIPDGWRVVHLKDIAYYSNDRIDNSDIDKKSYIGTDNLKSDMKGRCLSEYAPVEGQSNRYQKGDVLVSNIRPYFKKIWMADGTGGCSSDVLCIRPYNEKMSEFVYASLARDDFFYYDTAGAKGSKMPRGDKSHIMEYPIMFHMDTALKYCSTVKEMYFMIEKKYYENLELSSLRNFLLPLLMNGQLRFK